MSPVGRPGTAWVAAGRSTAGIGVGYLAVEPGDKLQVLHLGSGAERGWAFASRCDSAACPGTTTAEIEGWVPLVVLTGRKPSILPKATVASVAAGGFGPEAPVTAAVTPAATAAAVAVEPQGTVIYTAVASRDVATFPGGGSCEGYLAPVKAGERLEVMLVGEVGTDEEKWVWARRADPLGDPSWPAMGWLLREVAQRPTAAAAAASAAVREPAATAPPALATPPVVAAPARAVAPAAPAAAWAAASVAVAAVPTPVPAAFPAAPPALTPGTSVPLSAMAAPQAAVPQLAAVGPTPATS